MTPAEWLAIVFLASFTLSTMWNFFEPDSLVLKFNSNMRLVLALATQIAVVVLSLMVLSAGPVLLSAMLVLFVMGTAVQIARH